MLRNFLWITLWALPWAAPSFSQPGGTHIVDSLLQQVKVAESDSAKWHAMFKLSQYYGTNDLDAAVQTALQSLEFARAHLPDRIPRSLNNVGLHLMNKGEFDKAMTYFFDVLEAGKTYNCQECIATTLGNIGIIFWKKKDHQKAEQYVLQALEKQRALKDTMSTVRNLNNLGLIYTETGESEKAAQAFEEALGLLDAKGSTEFLGNVLNNLGNLYYYTGKYEKAQEYYTRTIHLSQKTGDNSSLILGYINSGWALMAAEKYREAINFIDVGEKLARKIKNDDYLANAYGSKADAYKGMGDFKNAFAYLEKYVQLKDTLSARLNSQTVAELETKYQIQQKEAQLARQQLEIQRQTNLRNITLATAAAVLLALFGLFQYLRSRQKIRRKEAELAAGRAEAAARLEHLEAEKLREMNQVKSTFFANISHEFRTPLTLLLSPLEQMINGSFRGDSQKYYRIMHRNASRLLNLVNQLLDLSKLESGKLHLSASEGDLGRFVGAVVGSFESLAVRQQVDLKIDTPGLPATCFFDRDKVEKILVNLVSNAFKFTSEGGKVKVAITMADDTATITVEDTGIGIPAGQLPHLFERFTKSSPSEVQAGSGIGLALTKELVELHGGTLAVKSEEGKGTAFTVTLAVGTAFFKKEEITVTPPEPLEREPYQQNIEARQKEEIPVETSWAGSLFGGAAGEEKPLLLLAEDNPDVRAYIAEMLAGDYNIIQAVNGKVGLEKAIEHIPDLVITDVMMPEMDGTAFCRQLKSNEKTSHIPIIMLTARAEQADKLEGLETGADDYLVKPFDATELQLRSANLVKQRRNLQAYYSSRLTYFSPSKVVEAESMDDAFLHRIREAVEANLEDETFSVVELAAHISMSRSQLHRKLTALTGFSPNQVIRNMRLERAKQLLEANAGTVSEVAFRCGFNSHAYFSKCFKDYFGRTPGEV
ncbi:MAG: tetratricopeptide repeat protein [Saprospiraceae bacterium]